MSGTSDRAQYVFGNPIDQRTYRKACASQARFVKRFGDDAHATYHLEAQTLPVIGDRLGVRNLVLSESNDCALDLAQDAQSHPATLQTDHTMPNAVGKPVVVGNIRMGFGHYRISMAMASAAHAMGYTPYWFDLASFTQSTGSKVIASQNELYSLGSRLSQQIALFNKLYWEPLNSEGFRKLTYNSGDQKNAELCVPLLHDLPKDVPYIGTHVWPAQAAVHAGLTHVVNAIPDNWPMALHLAEGSIHTVQTPSAYLGYHQLRGMDKKRQLKPMPLDSLQYTGHYVDHELVCNIERDCAARKARLLSGGPIRWLISVGGAGAQQNLFAAIIERLLPYVHSEQATLLVNVGDHRDVWEALERKIPQLSEATRHFDDFGQVAALAEDALDGDLTGIHAFCDSDIFSAVYSSNLLMRCSDVLITKPSEFSFYPVPKLMIHRVGGHEAWGAIRAAEVGDGTYEVDDTEEVLAMIDSFQYDRELVCFMCDNILVAKQAGIYDGAYKVVELAAK
ncbi:MAG: hypothetical protein IKG22_12430 [Atopobiaceae bacterium]|nr:hypothetical protein [Atopobiaceae bacterium]